MIVLIYVSVEKREESDINGLVESNFNVGGKFSNNSFRYITDN